MIRERTKGGKADPSEKTLTRPERGKGTRSSIATKIRRLKLKGKKEGKPGIERPWSKRGWRKKKCLLGRDQKQNVAIRRDLGTKEGLQNEETARWGRRQD